jgi:hypothetical protein
MDDTLLRLQASVQEIGPHEGKLGSQGAFEKRQIVLPHVFATGLL